MTAPASPTATPENAWRAPLLPVALALTAGVVCDRTAPLPPLWSAVAAAACLAAWFVATLGPQRPLALIYLWAAVACLGALYHHWARHHVPSSDIGHVAGADGVPSRLRGVVAEAPAVRAASRADPLRSWAPKAETRFVLRVTHRQDLADRSWKSATGQVQVNVAGRSADFTVGDEVEVLGRLACPELPLNASDFDYAGYLRDRGITATLRVQEDGEATLRERAWPWTPLGWLAALRGAGQRVLAEALPERHGLAEALLLGEGTELGRDGWEPYLRTGVIHVLAISGQHLVVLAGVLWLLARVVCIRRRCAAPFVALLLLAYALLAGGRPPVMRAAWMVGAYCGGILLLRPIQPANLLAFSWIGVALVQPTDVFNTGCQLSFLAVAVLLWGPGRRRAVPDPLERVIDAARPWPLRLLRSGLRWLGTVYLVNAAVWLVVAPLVAARYHLVSPIALLLGPPLVLLTSIALLAGFALLLVAPWGGPLAWPFALVTRLALDGCDLLVSGGARLPGGYFFVPDVPGSWLVVFYAGLLLCLATPALRARARWLLPLGAAWLALGTLLTLAPHRPGEFRCTFLAVGHGGCTVLESPGGRVVVYDAGALAGPDVTRRHIAPFLWSRGIRQIDEVILSHADLDHFNGLPALAERFRLGQVTASPSFAQRAVPAVRHALAAIEAAGVTWRVVSAGDHWDVDGIAFEVLHPPPNGPAGNENARSLVLHVTHGELRLLLTGDLEGPGLTQLLAGPAPALDVLQVPHHGSEKSDPARLAAWARPQVAVSCQARPPSDRATAGHYQRRGALYLGTWPHGTVSVRQTANNAWVETYRGGQRRTLR